MRHAVWVGAVVILVAGGPAPAQERKPEVVVKLEGHFGGVSALTFNPKVSLLATGAGNGVVRVWEAKSGDLVARADPLRSTGARVNHLAFSSGFDGNLLSASSRNAVVVWDLAPPPFFPKKPPESGLPELKSEQPAPKKEPALRELQLAFDEALGYDAVKIGTVTGDGKRVFYSSLEGIRPTVNSQALLPRFGGNTTDDLRGQFTPLAVAAVPNPDSTLVAMYGMVKGAEKNEQPAVAFVGLGDGRVVGRGVVRAPVAGRPVGVGFAPDGKWLVACNGEDLMYWRVPGSQVVEGDPKTLAAAAAYAAAAGPNGRVAFASPPEAGKKVKVTVTDLTGATPRVVAVYATDIDRVSALAFSPDGSLLAVGDDTEGVVQLWKLDKK